MLNPIAILIENALDSHPDLAGNHANAEVAAALANTLTVASWQQLAAVTGATVEYDHDGQLVLYTGCNVELPEPTVIHARDLTPEELAAEADTNGWAEPF